MFKALRSFDVYSKTASETQERTFSGALVTVIAVSVMFVLFCSEVWSFWNGEFVDQVYIDITPEEKIRVNFDVAFPHLPCSLVTVDAVDASGDRVDVHNIKKTPLSESGQGRMTGSKVGLEPKLSRDEDIRPLGENPMKAPNYCGSCYGAEKEEGQCCNTCESVRDAYQEKGWITPDLHGFEQCIWSGEADKFIKESVDKNHGCKFSGYMQVAKGSGNFHFALANSLQLLFTDMDAFQAVQEGRVNTSHVINSLSFGSKVPGFTNPLDGVAKYQPADTAGQVFFYYAKVVPTSYSNGGRVKTSNQFSVTEHVRPADFQGTHSVPGVYFFYDVSPIRVDIQNRRPSFLHFVTQLCAIIGGVYAVAGIVDKLLHGAIRMQQKMSIGKHS